MLAAIEWNYWTAAGAALAVIVAINIPLLKPLIVKLLPAIGSAPPETTTTVTTTETTPATSCCGKRAEQIKVVRELYKDDEAAVKALDDGLAEAIFDATKEA